MASPLARALCNPLRAQILDSITQDAASAAQLSERFGRDVDQIAYHVATLAEFGCIRPVETRKERTNPRRVYEPTPPR
jgi:predicted transcriptional regulator